MTDSSGTETGTFFVRSKIWIEDSRGKVIFGLGRYRILDAIGRLGSMHAAAKELHMSYRAVWMRVRSSEKRMGKKLIAREGKGSCLTPFAENLMKQYRRLLTVIKTETDEVYESLMTEYLS
jgi:molybdate transport system regulatory protein